MLKLLSITLLATSLLLGGCVSTVPMASKEQDAALKSFAPPSEDKSRIYIYRNNWMGFLLKRGVYVDGERIGESAKGVYFYKEVAPGAHKVGTESEFSNNEIDVETEGGKNYFVRQYVRMGLFFGGANVWSVSEERGRRAVQSCRLAASTAGNYSGGVVAAAATARAGSGSSSTTGSAPVTQDTRYLYQAEKLATAEGCTATTFASTGPGVEFYSATCDEKPTTIRCDFGKCAMR